MSTPPAGREPFQHIVGLADGTPVAAAERVCESVAGTRGSPPAALSAAVRTLAGGSADIAGTAEALACQSGTAAVAGWYACLHALQHGGVLWHDLACGGRSLVRARPTGPGLALQLGPGGNVPEDGAGPPWALSRFTHLYPADDGVTIATPLTPMLFTVHDERVLRMLLPFGAEAGHGDPAAEPGPQATAALLRLLRDARVIGPPGDDEALGYWELPDLLFHAWSRVGRSPGRPGAAYRFAGARTPPPVIKPLPRGGGGTGAATGGGPGACGPAAGRGPGGASEPAGQDGTVALPRPDMSELAAADPSFTTVLEARRSQARHGSRALTLAQLGEFLYRSARVRRTAVYDCGNGVSEDVAFYPYPGAGGRSELVVYPLINRCDGLGPGLYQYDPQGHRLGKVAACTPPVQRLARQYALASRNDPQQFQVALVITARFARMAWKYDCIGYALALKDVGALFQTMYLAGTAMGLAVCALGCGDSDLFARATSIPYGEEPSVGEFIVGLPPGPPSESP